LPSKKGDAESGWQTQETGGPGKTKEALLFDGETRTFKKQGLEPRGVKGMTRKDDQTSTLLSKKPRRSLRKNLKIGGKEEAETRERPGKHSGLHQKKKG